MIYELEFDPRALREWHKLGEVVKAQLKGRLLKVLQNPRVESAKLHDLPGCYKIKLRASGYRLVYQVRHETVVVFVIAVGKREKSAVYQEASKRL